MRYTGFITDTALRSGRVRDRTVPGTAGPAGRAPGGPVPSPSGCGKCAGQRPRGPGRRRQDAGYLAHPGGPPLGLAAWPSSGRGRSRLVRGARQTFGPASLPAANTCGSRSSLAPAACGPRWSSSGCRRRERQPPVRTGVPGTVTGHVGWFGLPQRAAGRGAAITSACGGPGPRIGSMSCLCASLANVPERPGSLAWARLAQRGNLASSTSSRHVRKAQPDRFAFPPGGRESIQG
jgi:hypothetical protein